MNSITKFFAPVYVALALAFVAYLSGCGRTSEPTIKPEPSSLVAEQKPVPQRKFCNVHAPIVRVYNRTKSELMIASNELLPAPECSDANATAGRNGLGPGKMGAWWLVANLDDGRISLPKSVMVTARVSGNPKTITRTWDPSKNGLSTSVVFVEDDFSH